ncbi:Semaphorin-5B [Stylophora pistillata]|uniref:Semaphorin-5B n=1 Tax=Stylophora pistillata TaxID=50429 RepID=A0A2B4S685_STYPI|nr:Semaphorin-5B [Stylophora pistillata]
MKQRNELYVLFLCCSAILSGRTVVASNGEPHSRTQFEEVKFHLETLKTGGIKSGNYSVLSVDSENDHLLVGAKDNAFLVELENMDRFRSWNLSSSSHAMACDRRQRTNLNAAPGRDKEFASDEGYFCRGDQNDSAVITEHGRVFKGTINPSSRSFYIHSQSFKQPGISEVFTDFLAESDFFSDVHFVKSFSIGNYVYFFFRERTLECTSCGKYKVSRVARICKGDYAGLAKLRSNFLTYQKAKLICTDGGEYPVYFHEIQDVWWDPETNLFHAIFTSHPNGPPSSACKVNKKYLAPNRTPAPDGMMATKNMNYPVYQDLLHDPLMRDPVLPTGFDSDQKQEGKAWLTKDGIRMTAIVLDKVAEHTVVYTSTDRGSVLKISQVGGSRRPCLLAEINLFPVNRQEVIKAMTIDPKRHVLYFGSNTALTKLRLEQCGSHTHRRDTSKLRQDLKTCPKVTGEIAWSSWKTCEISDGNLCRCQVRPCQDRQNSSCQGGYEFRLVNCTVDIKVGWEGREAWEMYGAQHGKWSAWDAWTECATKAWAGVRNRTRTCTNPVPRRGGRPCVGEAVQYEPCSLGKHEMEKRMLTNPTRSLNLSENKGVQFEVICKTTGYKISNISVDIVNKTFDCEKQTDLCGEGEWKAWCDWGQCSEEGFQIRRRECNVEPCVGEKLQERPCEPTPPSNCTGELDTESWDEWSVCECNHGLKLPGGSGLRFRQLKCRRECRNSSVCPDIVQYGTCDCLTAASTRPLDTEGSKFGSGHGIAIGLFCGVLLTVFTLLLVRYLKRKREKQPKSYNVPKSPEGSPQNRDCQYSPIVRENGVSSRGHPSSESQSEEKNRNPKTKTRLPFKGLSVFRKGRDPPSNV